MRSARASTSFNPRYCVLFLLLFLILPTSCDARREHTIDGRTMGTTYHIKVVTGYFSGISGLQEKIDRRLMEINRSMSTYQKDSEISRFNHLADTGVKFQISNDFLQVMQVAAEIHRLSGGAWDGTVNPLVDLWGFGRNGIREDIPAQEKIAELLAKTGFANIDIDNDGFLIKSKAAITLDLGSIAKGFGVDAVSDLIRSNGCSNFLVEIGGEVYASGYRKDGKPWRVGINRPRKDAALNDVYKVVSLTDRAFATSGDYRNFFEMNGVRYSHVIDPTEGYPVSNGVVSVSILADNCTLADGLATAVMVMGLEKGLDLINRLEGVEGFIVIEQKNGKLADYFSPGFLPEN